uniref:polysaccharide biosynthesis protein n=1 Tax=Rhodoblastus sp. TaxID=1962975 RepID=UPI003F954798
KALMEKITVAKSRHVSSERTVLCATRYGNVMASRGSVIPLFVSQIKHGRPLTVTDPQMTRFLMSLDQSVELVLFAYKRAAQGDIFVQKAPASTIETLFLALMKIFNKTVDVKIIGTRHGEKKAECLVSREEMARAMDLEEFYRIPADDRDLDYSKYFVTGEKEVSNLEDYTSNNTQILNVGETVNLLLNLDYIKNELKS